MNTRQQRLRLIVGQRLDLPQSAVHHVGAGLRLIERVQHRLRLRLHLVQHAAELAELRLHRAQHLPHLAAALFQRQRSETHLQAVEHGQQRGRPGQRHAVVALQRFHQAGAAQHFGVQPLGRQEQDREVGGVRRLDVLVGHAARFEPDARLQPFGRCLGAHGVGALLRVQQAFVVFIGKLGVNRQPDCAGRS